MAFPRFYKLLLAVRVRPPAAPAPGGGAILRPDGTSAVVRPDGTSPVVRPS